MTNSRNINRKWYALLWLMTVSLLLAAVPAGRVRGADVGGVTVSAADYDDKTGTLTIKGKGEEGLLVTVTNALDQDQSIGSDTPGNNNHWETSVNNPSPVPCQIRVEQARNLTSAVTDVDGVAPPDCAPEPFESLPVNHGQNTILILMNSEFGMHSTDLDLTYYSSMPAYSSIQAQVIRTDKNETGFPHILGGDPHLGRDVWGRETVVRDRAMDEEGNFIKYVLRYWHDAQPRYDGSELTTLISSVEGNSLLSKNTVFDTARVNTDGSLGTGTYDGATNVVIGDGNLDNPHDNYQNGVWNHLYIYDDLTGSNFTSNSRESDKFRLGVEGMLVYPANCGLALHPTGQPPTGGVPNDCGGNSNGNLLTFSGDTGTVVFTQMKVLENFPIVLTSPRIWEAVGLPLAPFEDTIDFFSDPGRVNENMIRPYVQMKVQLHYFDPAEPHGIGNPVLDEGNPVIAFGTAPIDTPNCERCHSAFDTPNSPNVTGTLVADMVQEEIDFWKAYYGIDAGDSDWYARLKGSAISILALHDAEHGTSFVAEYPGSGTLRTSSTCRRPAANEGNICSLHSDCDSSLGAGDGQCDIPQTTRTGHESVICQKCHADNVIAVVKSANCGPDSLSCADGDLIPPLTEAIHYTHREVSEGGSITFTDATGRSGSCQGCHSAHRSDGDMAGFPIDPAGNNAYSTGDNRDAAGGSFAGRDVHSNRQRNEDGAETQSHLNAVGSWLQANVAMDTGDWKGLWCTNCHNQASQELWRAENMVDLIHGDGSINVREPAGGTLSDVLSAINTALGTAYTGPQFIDWLDPKDPASDTERTTNQTSAIWAPDPGLCQHMAHLSGGLIDPSQDANMAIFEIRKADTEICLVPVSVPGPDCDGNGDPDFYLCGFLDPDGDFNANIRDLCTTPDCVQAAQDTLTRSSAVPMPFSGLTDGRDHWLSPGEPHCADCHAAPYTEQSGNLNPFLPFNWQRKASLFRYSRGHQDITCQGCHESMHGLHPVTPTVDTTTYAQAASLNHDDSHGPVKCGACHQVDSDGIPDWIRDLEYRGTPIAGDFDAAVSWAHGNTAESDPREDVCWNCHFDRTHLVSDLSKKYLLHADNGQVPRSSMDRVEKATLGHVAGDPEFVDPLDFSLEGVGPGGQGLCIGCHSDRNDKLSCSTKWKNHLIKGRVAEKVWLHVSEVLLDEPASDGTVCGY